MSKEGTFQKCTKCKEKLNCCQLFDKLPQYDGYQVVELNEHAQQKL